MEFARRQRVCLVSAKGPGKTCVLAWMLLNFLCTRVRANVAATSISADNLRDGLWSEVSLWLSKSAFLVTADDAVERVRAVLWG